MPVQHEYRHQNGDPAVLVLILGKIWLNSGVEGATTATPGGQAAASQKAMRDRQRWVFFSAFQLGPGWGLEGPSPMVTTVIPKSDNLQGLGRLGPRGRHTLPPAASQPSRPGVPLRLPPALRP